MPHVWHIRDRSLAIGRRPLILGIVNVTPDSFSDGGKFAAFESAVAHGRTLIEQGADMLDIGGESTRPGSLPVPVEEEARRVVDVVRELARSGAIISVDTSKPQVARLALEAGVHVINDVTALTDPDMPSVVRDFGAGAIIMHIQGTPATMQISPQYGDVVGEVRGYLQSRLHELASYGIEPERVAIDPGIGFGKTSEHNLKLLANLGEFQSLGRPLCLGVSRKGFIGRIHRQPVESRLVGSLTIAVLATASGTAQILRVHDVGPTREAVEVCAAIDAFGPHNPERA